MHINACVLVMKHLLLKLLLFVSSIFFLASCSKEEIILPQVVDTSVTNVSYYSVNINVVLKYGNVDITKLGVEYFYGDKKYIKELVVNGSQNLIIDLDDLLPNQTYKYRVYIECSDKKIWSPESSFKTIEIPLGTINNLCYSNLSETGFTVKASYKTPDGFPKKELVFVVKEKETLGEGLTYRADSDSVIVTDLKPNTFYEVIAYLTNEGGTVESSVLPVQTLAGKGTWNYLFGDFKWRFFPVFISDEENNIYFGLGTNGGNPDSYRDWNKFDGEKKYL